MWDISELQNREKTRVTRELQAKREMLAYQTHILRQQHQHCEKKVSFDLLIFGNYRYKINNEFILYIYSEYMEAL